MRRKLFFKLTNEKDTTVLSSKKYFISLAIKLVKNNKRKLRLDIIKQKLIKKGCTLKNSSFKIPKVLR